MRACHIVYGYFPFDPRVRREVETLRGHGHEVDVIALQEPGDAREESILGFHVYRVPLPIVRGGFARYAYQYLTFLLASTVLLLLLRARHRYRVVHIHSLPDFQVFCAAPLRLLGARVILDQLRFRGCCGRAERDHARPARRSRRRRFKARCCDELT